MRKAKTMELKGNEYAKVAERLKIFREDAPNGSIKTTYKSEGNNIIFEAYVVKDKEDPKSADATGHSFGELTGSKQFEKLETIAVGRALAMLGYLASGEVASGEEMQEYYDWKEQQKEEKIMEATEKLGECKSLSELKSVWSDLPVEAKKELEETKNNIKERLDESNNNKNSKTTK